MPCSSDDDGGDDNEIKIYVGPRGVIQPLLTYAIETRMAETMHMIKTAEKSHKKDFMVKKFRFDSESNDDIRECNM